MPKMFFYATRAFCRSVSFSSSYSIKRTINLTSLNRQIHSSTRKSFSQIDSDVETLSDEEEAYTSSEYLDHTGPHSPVMANEVIEHLKLKPQSTIVDMTFGAGGHTKRILEEFPDVRIFALDRDPTAHEFAEELSCRYPKQVFPLLGRFSELPTLLKKEGVERDTVDAFLFDFGCSSMQFDTAERGFALSRDGPLDMRMDGWRIPDSPTVADALAKLEEEDIARIIKNYGQEKRAKKIARAIIETRYSFRELKTTKELAELVSSTVVHYVGKDALGRFSHAATKTFQALRIFINNELNEINYGIVLAHHYLKMGGTMVTISFHSLEDTIVKRHLSGIISDRHAYCDPHRFKVHGKWFSDDQVMDITESMWTMKHKHVLTPSEREISENPRSRSAKFRAMVKVK